jgi:DNA-binding HxlR family transcriptional regulator
MNCIPSGCRCKDVGVRTYGQYCPIARASELLAERWSVIILRNIVILGCRTFNEIADGAPGLSRGLLSKRLRELERAGVLEIRPKADGPGSTYQPTQAGREFSDVMAALQHWGSQWAELTPEQAHPGVVLWMWVTFYLDHDRLPWRRVLVRFDYPTLSGPGSRGWLLIERNDAEVCEKHPGGEEHLVVVVKRSRGVRPLASGRASMGRHPALRGDRGAGHSDVGPDPSHVAPRSSTRPSTAPPRRIRCTPLHPRHRRDRTVQAVAPRPSCDEIG